jgi:hypothetical protein
VEPFRSVTPDPPPKKPPSARFTDASVVGAAVGRALAILVRQLPAFLVIALVTYAPLYVYAATWEGTRADIETMTLILAAGAVLLHAILTAALTYGVVEELAGRRVGVGKSVSVGLARMLPTLGLFALIAVMLVAATATVMLPLEVLAPNVAARAGGGVTMLLYCNLFVAVPVLVIERRGIGRAIARSVELTGGHRLSIFGVLFVLSILVRVVSLVVLLVVLPPAGGALTLDGIRLLAFSMIGVLMVAGLVTATISIVTYALLRDDKDGVGATELAKVFD